MMSVFAHLFLFVLGGLGVSAIFKFELRRFRFGNTGLYVKLRKAICPEDVFISKLKASILKSFLIRFILIAILASGLYAYCAYSSSESQCILGNSSGLSGLDYLGLWVSGSMILMVNRANKAVIYGLYGRGDWKVDIKNSAEPLTQRLAKIERKIKLGFYSSIIPLGSVIIAAMTLSGSSGDDQLLYYGFFTLYAVIVCVIAFGIWKKSRIAIAVMILFFLTFNYNFAPIDIEWLSLIYGIFIIILGVAMFASCEYHRITKFISHPDTH
ncbi:hypothetical protein N9W89_10100 [Hellea sp.]|nr:hypothetical protein [Hellea sp.]